MGALGGWVRWMSGWVGCWGSGLGGWVGGWEGSHTEGAVVVAAAGVGVRMAKDRVQGVPHARPVRARGLGKEVGGWVDE